MIPIRWFKHEFCDQKTCTAFLSELVEIDTSLTKIVDSSTTEERVKVMKLIIQQICPIYESGIRPLLRLENIVLSVVDQRASLVFKVDPVEQVNLSVHSKHLLAFEMEENETCVSLQMTAASELMREINLNPKTFPKNCNSFAQLLESEVLSEIQVEDSFLFELWRKISTKKQY